MKKNIFTLFVIIFLKGCKSEGPPVVVFLGSYFPAWIFYFIFSIILVLLLRIFLIKISIDEFIKYKFVFYVSLIVIVAFLLSLFFS